MTVSSKIIVFPRVPAPRPLSDAPRRFEGYPRFAREFASPLLPRAAAPPTVAVPHE